MAERIDPSGFIGRTVERARLDAALARAEGGRGTTIVVGGEAGIGKSRLVEEFVATAAARGATILAGSCPPTGGRSTPYAPFVEALRARIRAIEPGRLPALLGPGRRELARLLPELEATPAGVPATVDTDVHGQARLFEAILAFVESVSRGASCIVAVDDLQWADTGTVELLQFLIRNSSRWRVLFVLIVRTEELDALGDVGRFLVELDRDAGVDRVELGPLDARHSRELLMERVTASTGTELIDDLTARAGGNPFYLEQLAAAMDASPGHDRDLSPGLREILAARLAGLPARARQVIRAASAAGRRVDDEILAAVLDAPHPEVADALRLAMSRGILTDVDGIRGYAFRHALLREVAYGELLYGERDRLHAAFAAQLALRGRVGGAPVAAAELAYHWDLAGDVDHAVPAWIEAGAAAERTYAFADARRAYERALELWPEPPGDRAFSPSPPTPDRSELLHRAAEAAVLAGDYDAAVELGHRAIASLAAGQDSDPLRAGSLQERMRWYLWEAGDVAAASEALAEALRLIPGSPPSAERARALAQLAGLRLTSGDPAGAAEPAREALAIAQASDDSLGEEALALGILGYVTALGGRVDEGLDLFQRALEIAEQIGGVEGIALGQTNLAELLDRLGRTEASLETATAGFDRLVELGVARTYGGILAGHAAKALFDLGHWSESAARADAGLELDPRGPGAAWLHVVRARVDTNQGRFEEAAAHLATARSLMDGVGRSRSFLTGLLEAEADLAVQRGDLAAVWAVASDALRGVRAGGGLDPDLGWLVWHLVRAEADAVELAAAPGQSEISERSTLLETAIDRVAAVSVGDPRAAATSDLCRAEFDRYRMRDTPVSWAVIADAWQTIDRPFLVAYARYREGAAMLASRGSRTDAADALRRALAGARRLGAMPLIRDITVLAGHARIRLEEPSDAMEPATEDPISALGLTAREGEVIRLLAAGYSNQQIADELFLTRKTASVHVSNILGKLGVSNRVQAAAIAQRLGLAAEFPRGTGPAPAGRRGEPSAGS